MICSGSGEVVMLICDGGGGGGSSSDGGDGTSICHYLVVSGGKG